MVVNNKDEEVKMIKKTASKFIILIEKCTHVKGRKNVLLRKIKRHRRCLNGISVVIGNSTYIQN